MRHFIWIGSNIEPYVHLPHILKLLAELAGPVDVGRIVETSPIGMFDGAGRFLNVAVSVCSTIDPEELQRQLHRIETQLGRDRAHPDSKRLDRAADLDMLLSLPEDQSSIDAAMLPDYPFVRPLLLELLRYLKIDCADLPRDLPPGVELAVDHQRLGPQPTTFRSTALSRDAKL